MRTAYVYIQARWHRSKRSEEKVSRYTVRPGTEERTLKKFFARAYAQYATVLKGE